MSKTRLFAGRCILVVEDEYFIADDLIRLLRSEGAEIVGPLSEVGEGVRVAGSARRIDAAVLDINLHGDAAYPVADALRERGVPFVFATGYADGLIPAAYGEVPRIEKPYDSQVLARTLADLMDRSS